MFEYHNTWPINRYFLHIYALLCFNSVRWKLFYQCICFVLVRINCDCDKLRMFDYGTIGPVGGIKCAQGLILDFLRPVFRTFCSGSQSRLIWIQIWPPTKNRRRSDHGAHHKAGDHERCVRRRGRTCECLTAWHLCLVLVLVKSVSKSVKFINVNCKIFSNCV